MFRHEDVRHCANCAEMTAHLRHKLPLAMLIGPGVFLIAGVCVLTGTQLTGLGCGLLLLALLVYFRARRHPHYIQCNRCRHKGLKQLRRTQPTLDGHTTYDVL